MVHIKMFRASIYFLKHEYAILTVLVDLHLRFYAVEDLAARNHLDNNNGNIIKQAFLT